MELCLVIASGNWRIVATLVDTGETTAWIQAISYNRGTKYVNQIEKEQTHLIAGQNLYYAIPLGLESDWFYLYVNKFKGADVYITLLLVNQTRDYWSNRNGASRLFTSAGDDSGFYILKIVNRGSTDIFLEIVKPSGVNVNLGLNEGRTIKCQMQYDLEFLRFTINDAYDWIILDGAVMNDSSSATYMLIDPNLDIIVNYYSRDSSYFLDMNPISYPMLGTYYLAIFGNEYAEATVKVTSFESISSLGEQKIDQGWDFTQSGQAVYFRISQSQNYFCFAAHASYAGAKFQLIRPDQNTEWRWGVGSGLAYFSPKKPNVLFYVLKLQGQANCHALIHLRHGGQEDYQITTPDSSKYRFLFRGDLVVSRITVRDSDYLFQHYSYFIDHDADQVFVGFYDSDLNKLWEKTFSRYDESNLYHFPEQHPPELIPGEYIQIVIGIELSGGSLGCPIVQLTTLQTGDESIKFTTPFQTLPASDMGDSLWQVEVYEVDVRPTNWFEIVSNLYVNDEPISPYTPWFCVWAYGPPESSSSNLQGSIAVHYPRKSSVNYNLWPDPVPGKWLVVVAGIEWANSDKLSGSVSFVSEIDFKPDWVIPELVSGLIAPLFFISTILILILRKKVKHKNSELKKRF
jgi:hypothetical protein